MKKGSSDLLLLDVNALLAVAWPNHQFHHEAVDALSSASRWATCALTQLGFIRLSSNPSVVGIAKRPIEAATLLSGLVADSLHVYLDSHPSPVSESWRHAFDNLLGHQQVTDAYLLNLAAANHAVLATFDRRLAAFSKGAKVRVLG
jgi:hypothetical protein